MNIPLKIITEHIKPVTHQEKLRARWATRRMIRQGRLQRKPCEICGNPKSQAHHSDYSKRTQIEWLCAQHHKLLYHTKWICDKCGEVRSIQYNGETYCKHCRSLRMRKPKVARTHCGNGHEINEANAYWHEGKRYCRVCRKNSAHAFNLRRIRMTLLERRRQQFFRSKQESTHHIDTETLQCSCKAPMCFECGWCSAMCECPEKKQKEEAKCDTH